jgi:hypothetical protein
VGRLRPIATILRGIYKLLQRMAPQVGLESSVKRIFNDMQGGG